MLHAIFIICLTIGGLYALLSVFFSGLLELDFDLDLDFDFDFDLGSLLLPLRPFTIMVFLAVFGGVGLIAENFMSSALALLPAIPSGLLVAYALYWLIYVKLKKYETFAPSENDTIMQRAEVIEKIGAEGLGRISFVMNGNTLSGVAKEKRPGTGIEKGKSVYIVDYADNVYYVCEDIEIYLKGYLEQ